MNSRQSELSIEIFALNEEKFIERTFQEVYEVANQLLDRFEIILVNDGSTDRTEEIMDMLAQKYSGVTVIHCSVNQGLADLFRLGIKKASFKYFTFIPGDYSISREGLINLFEQVGKKPYIISYRVNLYEIAPLSRFLLSKTLTYLICILLRKRIRDVHGIQIYPVSLVRQLNLKSQRYSIAIEVFTLLFHAQTPYIEVPIFLVEETITNSRTLSLKTVFDFAKTYIQLLFRTWFRVD